VAPSAYPMHGKDDEEICVKEEIFYEKNTQKPKIFQTHPKKDKTYIHKISK